MFEQSRCHLPDIMLVLVTPFTAFAFIMVLPTVLRDGDRGWHLAAGAWMVAHGAVPQADSFSFTEAGTPWIAHEWLSELLMYAAALRAGGWGGLMLLFGMALARVALPRRRWLRRVLRHSSLSI